jgi:N-acetylneuraminic acid mutarotase
LYIIGGFWSAWTKVQIFDVQTNRWTAGPELPKGVGSPSVVAMQGTIRVCGGLAQWGENIKDCFVLNSQRTRWSPFANMLKGVNHQATGTDGNNIYVFGGRTLSENIPGPAISTVQMYSTQMNAWSFLADLPLTGRGGAFSP